MFRDLYRSRPHLGMIYVAMKSLRRNKLLWWKLPHDPARAGATSASTRAISRRRKLRSAQPERGPPDYLKAGGG